MIAFLNNMVIRGDQRSTRLTDFVSGEYGWPPLLRSLLAHPSLPWWDDPREIRDVRAMPLDAALPWGLADRMALLAQHAAHLEFLSFCGVPESEFDPASWGVQRDRSSGLRLIRLSPPAPGGAETPALTSLQAMARFLSVEDAALPEASWASAAWIYRDLALTLGGRAATRWLRLCGVGYVRSPGLAAMGEWLSSARGTLVIRDADDRRIVAAVTGESCEVRIVGDSATPVAPFSAWQSAVTHVSGASLDESSLAENLIAESPSTTWVVMNADRFDARSQTLATLLAELQTGARWLVGDDSLGWLSPRSETLESAPASVMMISPRLSASRHLGQRFAAIPQNQRRAAIEQFCDSESWFRFLSDAILPAATTGEDVSLPAEPARSFVASIAIAGRHVPRDVASPILARLGSSIELDDLAFDGLTTSGDTFSFASEDLRRMLVDELPANTRAGLASLVAEVLVTAGKDRLQAAAVLLEHRGEDPLATLLLSESLREHPREAAELAAAQPLRRIAARPELLSAAARVRIAEARYLDARVYARALESDEGEYLLAYIERRLGHYHDALALVPPAPEPEYLLLRAELLRLLKSYDEAREALRALPDEIDGEERLRSEYVGWLLDDSSPTPALDAAPESHWTLRMKAYQAMAQRNYRDAIVRSQAAALVAPDTGCAIDSWLDELAFRFLEGDWDTARHQARLLLRRIERTQGDRAAVGALLILGFVCADYGLVDEASVTADRLRAFLLHDGDPVRLLESELLRSAAALAAGRWSEVRAAARAILIDESLDGEIRAAAAWLDAEATWASGGEIELHPALDAAVGSELRDRALLCASRTGSAHLPHRPFLRQLAEWERDPSVPAPVPETAADEAMLERSRLRRESSGRFGHHDVPSQKIDAERAAERLHHLASSQFPPDPALGIEIVTRNRLGEWSAITSDEPLTRDVILEIESESEDWTTIDSSTWMRVRNSPPGSAERRAIVAVVSLRLDRWRRARVEEQESRVPAPAPAIDGFVGSSAALARVRSTIARIARRDEIPVTIIGESGTGKELAAVALHKLSGRRQKAFVPVNCAALSEQLIESELFGHARGAFTGADRDRVGLLESADGGTLFLDEIGELPLPAQAKLLRFLQEKEFRRVGETQVRRADVRLLAATHRQLEEWVDEGRFRGDLFYRIRGIEIVVPPLRDRQEDILEIAQHFLARCFARNGGARRFSHEVEAVFLTWNWPGNVRELENVVGTAHALAGEGSAIELEHLPPAMHGLEMRRSMSGSYYLEVTRFRRSLIERSLDAAGGNQSQAAKTLGMTRQALAYQIRELGILVRKS